MKKQTNRKWGQTKTKIIWFWLKSRKKNRIKDRRKDRRKERKKERKKDSMKSKCKASRQPSAL